MKKLCQGCGLVKDESEFNKHKTRGTQTYCRLCQRGRDRLEYHSNPERRLDIRSNQARNIEKAQRYVVEHLRQHPCVDCRESNIVLLEFDHQRDKKFDISAAVTAGYSIKRIQSEIDKCLVRCVRCHRIKTAIERKFWIMQYVDRV